MSEGSGSQGDIAKSNSAREVVSAGQRSPASSSSSKAIRGVIHRRSGLNSHRNSAAEQEEETIRLANEYMLKQDVTSLRKLAAIRGLVNANLRKRAWPFMLGTKTTDVHGTRRGEYQLKHTMSHKDDAVVNADMERSLWKYTKDWTDEERDRERQALKRIVNATVEGNEEGIFYYQGLHDVASVLLFVCGEGAAHSMLARLAHCHLRDCTRSTIQPAISTLKLLYPILYHADQELHSFIMSLGEPALEVPYFALSWLMTWFSHDLDGLEESARLFDLFLASHPLMPLYVAAEVVRHARDDIMRFDCSEGPMVYSYLNKLRILGPEASCSANCLAQEAAALYKRIPPAVLATGPLRKELILYQCTTPFAYLEADRWNTTDSIDYRQYPSSHPFHPRRIARKAQTVVLGALLTGLAGMAMILSQQQAHSFRP